MMMRRLWSGGKRKERALLSQLALVSDLVQTVWSRASPFSSLNLFLDLKNGKILHYHMHVKFSKDSSVYNTNSTYIVSYSLDYNYAPDYCSLTRPLRERCATIMHAEQLAEY